MSEIGKQKTEWGKNSHETLAHINDMRVHKVQWFMDMLKSVSFKYGKKPV